MVVSEQNLIPEYYIKLKFCSFGEGVKVDQNGWNLISEGIWVWWWSVIHAYYSAVPSFRQEGGGGQWAKPHFWGWGWCWSVSKTTFGGEGVVVVSEQNLISAE